MEVLLARLDALRRRGPELVDELRRAFRAAVELLQVTPMACGAVVLSHKVLHLHRDLMMSTSALAASSLDCLLTCSSTGQHGI